MRTTPRKLSPVGDLMFSAGAESFYLSVFALCMLACLFGCAALDAGIQWTPGKTAALVSCAAVALCAFVAWITAATTRRGAL